ncbi:MAG: tetratricopeptide repeat protein [Rhodanobacter sp.]|nr:MAG: tetratricopeptide repeat protein [Rhodanobacter sp.]TAM43058.1 MAG: tetratricopeptide repeat protein [Rhodanobacter sp.]TAN25603.1 MAG: tetratricopeptide repeat protein [Rhodanobacter sp.]
MLAAAALLFGLASSPALARHPEKTKQATEYPDSTRVEPKLDLTKEADQKQLQAGYDALNKGDTAAAEATLQALLDKSRSKYAQAMALRGLALAKYNTHDYKASIALLQRALTNGVLPNDAYFDVEYMLAAAQQADEQYQASLATIAKWRAEGKKETPESYAIEGNDQYRLGNYAAAIAAVKKAKSLTDKPNPQWDQILMASYAASGQGDQLLKIAQDNLAAHPDDPKAIETAIQALQQAQKYPEAIKVMEAARAKGLLDSEENYVLLASLYYNQALSSDDAKPLATKAVAVINEGMNKGIMQPSADNYVLLGKADFVAGDMKAARQAFDKALPLAKDGEPALQIANMELTSSQYAKAKAMVKEALSKGVKHTGTAYLVLAECERGLHDKAARIAALKQAAQQPESAAHAKELLKQLGVSGK